MPIATSMMEGMAIVAIVDVRNPAISTSTTITTAIEEMTLPTTSPTFFSTATGWLETLAILISGGRNVCVASSSRSFKAVSRSTMLTPGFMVKARAIQGYDCSVSEKRTSDLGGSR